MRFMLHYQSVICLDFNLFFAAQLMLQLPGRAPVSSAMHNSLHWLNFPQQVTYKLCLLTYKCLHGLAPDYLTRLCVHVATVHGRPRLQSSDDHQLLIPWTHTVFLGPCAFNTSGPASWNTLPAELCDPAVTLGTFRQMLESI